MRKELFLASFTFGAAFSVPGLAWAAADCGNPPVKTAEAVYTIQTPEKMNAPKVNINGPAQIAVQPQTLESAELQIIKTAEAAAPAANAVVANYTALLERRITRGQDSLNLFDYAGAKAAGEMKVIKAYTDYLASQNPDSLSEADQIAYWANLTVNGKVLSLNDIEHEILRKRYPNPALVHYMVNCASIGCPNLQPKLWSGATLDADRDAAARAFINSSRGVAIKGNKLKVSSIYNWFKEDFGGSKSEALKHFRKYAGPDLLSPHEY